MVAFWKGTALTAGNVSSIYANPTVAYVLANFSTNLSAVYGFDDLTA
jgi:hypothetical protein